MHIHARIPLSPSLVLCVKFLDQIKISRYGMNWGKAYPMRYLYIFTIPSRTTYAYHSTTYDSTTYHSTTYHSTTYHSTTYTSIPFSVRAGMPHGKNTEARLDHRWILLREDLRFASGKSTGKS